MEFCLSVCTLCLKQSFSFILFFRADSPAEHEIVRKAALANGAFDAVVCTHWSDGGAGATDLADALINACSKSNDNFKFLYELSSTIEEKITKISKEMYGAGSVEFTPQAKSMIKLYSKLVCFTDVLLKWFIQRNNSILFTRATTT